ncbi:peptidylprolyl isomerase [Clostridium perfringens]|uniref:peptidylprolyl isomerase n=1 Tax=Clostridium perfringens TaxID=1502 RepID=UPI00016BD91E|nr:peptidylprolyl isomerase [Clostridium perfringens]EGT0680929.1 peptidylprolyl isomerase [Clostridium perfringens]EHK2335884.1 peptidylprolyl isomerase [Clostridium perfringens]MDH5069471.1 Foldase protein PrsA 1 precursor [Clostridium perfringens]MDH5089397.1 Foldase protein PrsA 1 precursor [Clostridium perfringens]MDU2093174.1 peptidylprolyl isomerase [Clostridium perfringens]
MVSVKKIVASALVGVLMFSAVGCNMVEKTQAAIDKTTVATVNGEKITLGEVDSHLKGVFAQMKSQYGDKYMDDPQVAQQILQQRQSVVQGLVTDKVLGIEADKLGIKPSEEEIKKKVDEQFENIKKGMGDNFDKALEAEGYTEDTFKEFLKNQVIAEATVEYATKDVKVSDEDIKKYYDENKQQFVVKAGADVKHLLFPTEEEAQKAYDEIQSGKTTFDDLFNKYEKNKDPKKEPIAENLGRVDYNNSNFDKDFMEGLKGLKDGEISKPVKSSFGYHIIKATNITDKETQLTEEQAKEQIISILENQKKKEAYQKDLEQWKKDLNVKVYDDKLQEGLKISK